MREIDLHTFTEKEQMQKLFFADLCLFVGTSAFLLVAFAMASACPNTSIPTLGFTNQNGTTNFSKQYKLSDTAIVSEVGPTLAFKILLPVLLACGIISLGLIFWKVSNAKDSIDEEDGAEDQPGKEHQGV